MSFYALKVLVSAVLIVAISEVARRSTLLGALIASLPLVSLLAILWLHFETGDAAKIAALSASIFWLVLPSLAFFVVLPVALRAGWPFWPSLICAIGVTVACYGVMIVTLQKFGLKV
jgi:hypothetical protein